MKLDQKFACTHTDLTALLSPLKTNGVYINEGEGSELYILSNWRANIGDKIFHAKPAGRKGDEIWYGVIYTDEFEKLFMGSH